MAIVILWLSIFWSGWSIGGVWYNYSSWLQPLILALALFSLVYSTLGFAYREKPRVRPAAVYVRSTQEKIQYQELLQSRR